MATTTSEFLNLRHNDSYLLEPSLNDETSSVFPGNISFTHPSILFSSRAFNLSRIRIIAKDNSGVAEERNLETAIIIPLYSIIFLLCVIGNSLVVITLTTNRRMRTVTNVYLLNLAISDLLLGVFCIPFTLVGQVLRNFIFGSVMCKLIPYIQAVAVSVGVWTLVAISLERYFAICRPLSSRRWQTEFHAYKMIFCVWGASMLWCSPVIVVSNLKALKENKGCKCREDWPNRSSERSFNLFLDAILLLVPVLIMSLAYSLIVTKLWKGLQIEIRHNNSYRTKVLKRTCSSPLLNENVAGFANNNSEALQTSAFQANPMLTSLCNGNQGQMDSKTKRAACAHPVRMWLQKRVKQNAPASSSAYKNCYSESNVDGIILEPTYTFSRHAIRSNYMEKSIEAKKKVIRMLFVLVSEFFFCWAPLHILNTWYLFYPKEFYSVIGSNTVSLVQLLAYISSCTNPITYCFMNKKFRQAFLKILTKSRIWFCLKTTFKKSKTRKPQVNFISRKTKNNDTPEMSRNESVVFVAKASTTGRSEIEVLEMEEGV